MAVHHRWDLSPREASLLQKELAAKIITRGGPRAVRLVAGADVHPDTASGLMKGVVCVLTFPALALVEWKSALRRTYFPYVPGLLSFRESPVLLECFAKLKHSPDVALFDAQGIAHPRRFGLASHMGLVLDIPSIGCAKSPLYGSFGVPGPRKGDRSAILDGEENVIGCCLRTRDAVSPLFVSTGHKISLENAVTTVLACTGKYRIPEPLRMAHGLAKHGRLSNR